MAGIRTICVSGGWPFSCFSCSFTVVFFFRVTSRAGQQVKWAKVSDDKNKAPRLNVDTSKLKSKLYQVHCKFVRRLMVPTCSFLLADFPQKGFMSVWLKPASETESSCYPSKTSAKKKKIQEQLNQKVLLVALNKKKRKKKNRLGKHFCLLIGPVAVVTEWHHDIINRCLIRLAVHGESFN